MIMSKKGFTLIELVLVITILGIIAVSALPSFSNMTTQAERASKDAVAGAIQTSVQLFRANDMALNGPPGNYPTELDPLGANTACAPANPCFGGILLSTVSDNVNGRGWTKIDGTTYTFNDGSSTFTFIYSPVNGTFTQQ
jgi:prepilin-type N-terminal cleavage/methylation domain-containing protein